MNPRCIVQVADYRAPFSTNFDVSLLELGRQVRDRLDLDSAFVFSRGAVGRPWLAKIRAEGIPVRFLDRDATHRDRVRALRRIAEETQATLLHTHFGTFDVDAAFVASRLSCGILWHMHSPYPIGATLRGRLGERAKFQVVGRLFVDRIVAVSESVAESAVSHGGPRSKLSVVLNGIDTRRLKPFDTVHRVALRQRYAIPEDSTVFLLFGWTPRRKGVDLLAQASKRLQRVSDHPCVCLVTRGEDNEAELLNMIRDAPALRLVSPVPEVSELYGLADCFISASRAEGLPYAIGEAMASGLPVVSSDLPQVVAAYGPAGPGFLSFQSGNASDLAEAMARVSKLSPEERRELAAGNRAYIREHLSLEKWTDEMIRLYRSVFADRARRAKSIDGDSSTS